VSISCVRVRVFAASNHRSLRLTGIRAYLLAGIRRVATASDRPAGC